MNEPELHQERDAPPRATVVAILVGTLIVIVIGVMIAYFIGSGRATDLGQPGIRIPIQPEIPPVVETTDVPVETTLFGQPARGVLLHREADERLSSFGWVDLDRGVVHVPIEAAMEIVLERQGRQEEEQP